MTPVPDPFLTAPASSGYADFRAKAARLREQARRARCAECRENLLLQADEADARAETFSKPPPEATPAVRRPTEIPAPVERAAQAYLHMVPFCETCLGRSTRKLLIRRCADCKNLAYEFAWTMLTDAFEGRDLEDAVSAWWQQQAEQGVSASQEEFSRSLAQAIRASVLGADS